MLPNSLIAVLVCSFATLLVLSMTAGSVVAFSFLRGISLRQVRTLFGNASNDNIVCDRYLPVTLA
jgi:hypothetical protein